jgi:hypothetical protein
VVAVVVLAVIPRLVGVAVVGVALALGLMSVFRLRRIPH